MRTNVTNGTIRKRQKIAFERLMLGKAPSLKLIEYIGMDFFELKKYLAPRMRPGMNWNNYGDVWQVEQLAGLELFDLRKEEDCKLAWSYKNMIPVYGEHIFHVRRQCSFSLKYLESVEKCPIVDKLISILIKENKQLERYFEVLTHV